MKTKSVKMIEALSSNQLQLINGGYYLGPALGCDNASVFDGCCFDVVDDCGNTLDFISYMGSLVSNPIDDGGCINIY